MYDSVKLKYSAFKAIAIKIYEGLFVYPAYGQMRKLKSQRVQCAPGRYIKQIEMAL